VVGVGEPELASFPVAIDKRALQRTVLTQRRRVIVRHLYYLLFIIYLFIIQ
jgi:hypothetical protein